MATISGFTFIHNAIQSGYPLVEAIRAVAPWVDEIVVVDMQSTDGTRSLLEEMDKHRMGNDPPLEIIDCEWGNQAGETLRQAHSLYKKCSGDIIVHFEADEVYDDSLMLRIIQGISFGIHDIAVYRLQLEQNFQRCRWYPEPVHRVFPRNSDTIKDGHTTNRHKEAVVLEPEIGFLWDITNCFRDNWFNRIRKQAELRQGEIQHLMVGLHSVLPALVDRGIAELNMNAPHWLWKTTPFNIPEILKPLLGMTKYEPKI